MMKLMMAEREFWQQIVLTLLARSEVTNPEQVASICMLADLLVVEYRTRAESRR